jgi:hypothetical protein
MEKKKVFHFSSSTGITAINTRGPVQANTRVPPLRVICGKPLERAVPEGAMVIV